MYRPYRRPQSLPTLRPWESFALLLLAGASLWHRAPELFR